MYRRERTTRARRRSWRDGELGLRVDRGALMGRDEEMPFELEGEKRGSWRPIRQKLRRSG